MEHGLKEEFKEDYDILASKFWKQKADLAFIQGKNEEAKAATEKGLELVVKVVCDDENTQKATNHCHRDLLNLLVRVRSRMEKKEARGIRTEEGKNRNIGTTFLKLHDDAKVKLDAELEKMGKQIKQK